VKEIIKHYGDSLVTFCAAIVMGGQYYLESIVGLEPCNLCLLQKYSVQAVFLIFLIKMIVPKFKIIFDILGSLCTLFWGFSKHATNLPSESSSRSAFRRLL
jgi:disulfide bond formation protein DsbB